jgi:hypothetical protein
MQQLKKQLRADGGGLMLYIVEATTPERQWLKIGITTELLGRVRGIACGCPIPIDIVWYRDVGAPEIAEWAEKVVHANFFEQWSSGEWFVMTSDAALRSRIDSAIARFCKPAQWRSVRFDDSPWRKRTNKAEKLHELANRRAESIEQSRKLARETPLRLSMSASEISSIYKSK